MITLGAGRDVTSERSGSAGLNRGHDLKLWQVQMACMLPAIGRTMGEEDIRNLQFWAGH